MIGLTDIHQHVLWGLDDGPKSAKGMHAMLREAHAQKIRRIFATPHVCPGFEPFDALLYEERLGEAQEYCDAHELGIELCCGAEIAWTYNAVEMLRRRQIPTLGSSDCVLLELWDTISWDEARSAVKQVLRAGFTPVLAHVERYWCFAMQPKKAIELRNELEIAYQVDAAAILAPRWPIQQRFIRRMLDEQALDAVASDAHDCDCRPIRLKKAYRVLEQRCGGQYAAALVNFNGVIK